MSNEASESGSDGGKQNDIAGAPPFQALETAFQRAAKDGERRFPLRIRGTIVDVRDSSGAILRCPDCSRVLKDGKCRVHAKVQGVEDVRVKAIIDDGTGAVLFVLSGDKYVKEFLGVDRSQLASLTRDGVIAELECRLLGKPVEITGELNADDFGYIVIATSGKVVV